MTQYAHTSKAGPDAGVSVLDSLLGRASSAARRLVSVSDAHSGGTSAMVQSYQDIQARLHEAEAGRHAAEVRMRSMEGELARLSTDRDLARSETARYREAGHEALRQARILQRERDEARESLAELVQAREAMLDEPYRRTSAAMLAKTVPEFAPDESEVMSIPPETAPIAARQRPKAPFTRRLLAAIPRMQGIVTQDDEGTRVEIIRTSVSDVPPRFEDTVACLEEADRISIANALDGFAQLARRRTA